MSPRRGESDRRESRTRRRRSQFTFKYSPFNSRAIRPEEKGVEGERIQNGRGGASYDVSMYPRGNFAQAMSSIACNAESEARGVFDLASQGKDSFNEKICQALAIKLNLKTNQQANEKVLLSLVKSGGKSAGLKQTLQARAAVYGSLLDPA